MATNCALAVYAGTTDSTVRSAVADEIHVTGVCPSAAPDPSTVTGETKTYYDGNNTSLGAISTGQPTEVDKLVDAASQYYTKQTTTYDSWGRPYDSTTYTKRSGAGVTTATRYTQNSAGQVTAITTYSAYQLPEQQVSTTKFDRARGLQTEIVDASGATADASYDALGRLISVWKPGQTKGVDPATVLFSYLLQTNGPRTITTKTLVDPGLDATGKQKPLTRVVNVDLYDQFGQLRQTQTSAGDGTNNRVVKDSFRDSHGWVVRTNDRWPTNGAPSSTLITVGRSAVDSRTVTQYDGAGRPTVADAYHGVDKVSTTSTYYGGDRVTIDPPDGGVETTTIVDSAGTKTELDRWTVPPTIVNNLPTGGAHETTTYAYDTLGRQTSVTTAVNTANEATWTSTYDLAGRKTHTTSPDSGTVDTTYDDTGSVTSVHDATGRTIVNTYDSLGRKIGEYAGSVAAANQVASWVYDTLLPGKPTSSTRITPDGRYTVAVTGYSDSGDPLGTKTSLPTGSGFASSYTTSFTWGQTHLMLTQTPAPAGGLPPETIKYYYDNHGNPTTTTGQNAYVSNTTWDVYDEPAQYILGVNSQRASYTMTRDPRTRLLTSTDLSTVQATPQVEHTEYAYDSSGNVTGRTETQGDPANNTRESECFKYDSLAQMTEAWSAASDCSTDPLTTQQASGRSAAVALVGGTQPYWTSWTLDEAGSRTQQLSHSLGATPNDTTVDYVDNTNGHLHALYTAKTTVGTHNPRTDTYTYNADGSTKRIVSGANPIDFSYDVEGRTSEVSSAAADTTYVYSADGAPLLQKSPTASILFLPGEQLSKDAAGTITATRYYSHNGSIVSMRTGSDNPTYLYSDQNGTSQVALSTTGTGYGTVSRRYVDSFGNALGTADSGWNDARTYLGMTADPSGGLINVGAREYNPATGRFLSVDPVVDPSDPAQMNGYNYGWQNPQTHPDPTGREPRLEGHCYDTDAACKAGTEGGYGDIEQTMRDLHPNDYTTRHNGAEEAAKAQILAQQIAAGLPPGEFLSPNTPVADAAKKCFYDSGVTDCTYGKPDILYRDAKGVVWVWEVKAASQARFAAVEAQWYVDHMKRDPNFSCAPVAMGWTLGGPFDSFYPGDKVIGPEPGAVIYGREQNRNYTKQVAKYLNGRGEPANGATATPTAEPLPAPGEIPGTSYRPGYGLTPLGAGGVDGQLMFVVAAAVVVGAFVGADEAALGGAAAYETGDIIVEVVGGLVRSDFALAG